MSLRIFFLLFMILLAIYSVPVLGQKEFKVARVVDVKAPTAVQANASFQVQVIAEYSDVLLIDVGVFDSDNGKGIQSYTKISGFTGPGTVTFNFNLTAPNIVGRWNLTAATRAWWRNSWYADSAQGSMRFNVIVYGFPTSRKVIIVNNEAFLLELKINGEELRIPSGERLELQLNFGKYEISVPAIVELDPAERLVFKEWSDGITASIRDLYLFSDTTLIPIYQRQYYLTVLSAYGRAVGEGWYDADSVATIGAPSYLRPSQEGFSKTLYRFERWTGDLSSTQHLDFIVMDRPKKVEVLWTLVEQRKDFSILYIISAIFFIISLIVLGQSFLGRLRPILHNLRELNPDREAKILKTFFLAILIAISLSFTFTAAGADSDSLIIDIGPARWHYWNRLGSDTCLIWLGGGVYGDKLLINPFWLESYNTMRFVQDLSSHYSVLAIERGSYPKPQPELERTVYAEIYRPGFLKEAREWAMSQGYSYVYLVGYSVGGSAAAMEATLADPDGWASPNGIVLITVPMSSSLKAGAKRLRSNLLILYGEKMTPTYIASGKAYFNQTQGDNTEESARFQKEFYVLEDVAHEVWTIAETGIYTPRAAEIVIQFIETSKISHFKQYLVNDNSRTDSTRLELMPMARDIRVSYNKEVMAHSLAHVTIDLAINGKIRMAIALRQLDPPTIIAVSERTLVGEEHVDLIIRSPPVSGVWRLRADFYAWADGQWIPTPTISKDPFDIVVSDDVTLKLDLGFPDISVEIDGNRLTSSNEGEIKLEADRGEHTITIQPIHQFPNGTRIVFLKWADGDWPATRKIILTSTTNLRAVLKRQHYLDLQSDYGQTSGGGWYDENSLARFSVSPPILEESRDGIRRIIVFDGWNQDINNKEAQGYIHMTEPKAVRATWVVEEFEPRAPSAKDFALPFTTLSCSILFLIIVFASLFRKRPLSHEKSSP